MEDKTPIFIIIVLVIVVGLAYGPIKNSSSEREGGSTKTTSTQGSSSVGQSNTNSATNLGETSNKVIAGEIKKIERDLKRLEQNIARQTIPVDRSPYYGKIRMSNITGVRQSDPSKEYLTLSTNLKITETINITGWYFRSEVTGNYAIIGRASLLPFPNTKTESDIVLQKGDKAIITKGFSPIGISFRTNKCTGYFEENRTFYPRLPLQCPRPKDQNLPLFSSIPDRHDECIKIIERIGRCRTINNAFIRDLPDTVTASCKTYLTTQVNYNTCVATHFGDTDFPGNIYRVYLGRFGTLWKERNETINLHDENGLIVATIKY
jgi:hypothetical protein